jgi:cation diffusion facilitator CzcD-associated flavoprotein CzcO
VNLEGKRVALVGTGSTATQILCATVDTVKHLTVFQRTPQWVLPVPNPPIGKWMKRLLRFRPFAKRHRRKLAEQFAVTAKAIVAESEEARAPRRLPTLQALDLIRDPMLRAKLTPSYQPSCKRMVISDRFHDAIQRPNVELVTERIERVGPNGILTADGKLHEIDVLVLATGFVTDKYLDPMDIVGRDGIKLVDQWSDLFVTYKTVGVPAMPNFFMVNGPYGPVGSAVVPAIAEVQANYVMQLIDHVMRDGVALEPRAEKATEWVDRVREQARHSVFGDGGCKSYYLDRFGVPTINPQTVEQMREEMGAPLFEDYIETPMVGAVS